MASKGREELIGRAITDKDFRQRLLKDPEGTIRAEGFVVDAETLAKLKQIDPVAAEEAAKNLDETFASRAAGG